MSFIDGYKNCSLHFKEDIPKDLPIGIIVIVHGICEHLGRYDYLTNKLTEKGYVVYRFDLRGHGRSSGKRGNVDSFMDYLYDLDIIVDKAHQAYPALPIFILGHSMGGFIVNAYGSTYIGKVNGIISSGAPGIIIKSARPLIYIPKFLFGFFTIKNKFASLCSRDLDVVKKYVEDPLVLKKTKINLLKEVFIKGINYLNKHIKSFTDPVLYLHGKSDKIVEVESSIYLHEVISSKDNEIKLYDNLFHEILNEPEKYVVISDILEWLGKRI